MNMSELFMILDDFQTGPGKVYRYVNRTWWGFNVDEARWEHLAVKERMARSLVAITVDLFPDNVKIQKQVTRDYIQDRLIKGLVPRLSSDTLPRDPFS